MSDPVTNEEVEDVLSSIRRLVSADKRPIARKIEDPGGERLVLTPAHRIAGAQPDLAGEDAPEDVESPAADPAELDHANETSFASARGDADTVKVADTARENDEDTAEPTSLEDAVTQEVTEKAEHDDDIVEVDDDFEERLHREIEGKKHEQSQEDARQEANADIVTDVLEDGGADHETPNESAIEIVDTDEAAETRNQDAAEVSAGEDSDPNEDSADYLWTERRREDFLPAKRAEFHGQSAQADSADEAAGESNTDDPAGASPIDTFTLSKAEAEAVLSASKETENFSIPVLGADSDQTDTDSDEDTVFTLADRGAAKGEANSQQDAASQPVHSRQSPDALESKIEALESAVGRISTDWEPDDAGTDDYSGTKAPSMNWADDVELDAKGTPVVDDAADVDIEAKVAPMSDDSDSSNEPEDTAEADEAETAEDTPEETGDALEGAPEETAEAEEPELDEPELEDVAEVEEFEPDDVEPEETAEIEDVEDDDPTLGQPGIGIAALGASASPSAREDAESEQYVTEEQYVDEEMLRDLVGEIVRSELQGVLGERITRNVRKLVRREIQRALTAQEIE
ncbi:MAG: hypothetical protein WBC93_16105 [Sulfitobacter sp.]